MSGVNATPVTYTVHVDHLNRPIKMTDSTKAAVWDAVWAPWGNVYSITGTATLDARLPGQWFQLESGLHYNWYRHYDPTIGRYTQPDPLGFVDGPSVYGYAKGSPQRYVDRDGQNVVCVPLLGLGPLGPEALVACEIVLPVVTRWVVRQCVKAVVQTTLRQIEYDHAKTFCDTPDPWHEEKSVSCSLISLVIDRAEHCADLYQKWDDRWEPRRHIQKIAERLARAENYKELYRRKCMGPR